MSFFLISPAPTNNNMAAITEIGICAISGAANTTRTPRVTTDISADKGVLPPDSKLDALRLKELQLGKQETKLPARFEIPCPKTS